MNRPWLWTVTSVIAWLCVTAIYAQVCTTYGKFGDNCYFDCHCDGGVSCDKATGQCPPSTACSGNWSKLACQLGDVSREKRCKQSSDYQEVQKERTYASNAIDGIYATDKFQTCTHTAVYDPKNSNVLYHARHPNAWWQIDFGAPHVVYSLILYNRIFYPPPNDDILDRLSYFDVRVGNNDESRISDNALCQYYNDRVSESWPKPWADIECTEPLLGRYLSVQLRNHTRADRFQDVLNICEVDIRGYKDCTTGGKFGPGCQNNCWCYNQTECTFLGNCTSGCAQGRLGKYCMDEVQLEKPVIQTEVTSVNLQWRIWKATDTYVDSRRGDVGLIYVIEYSSNDTTWTEASGTITTSPVNTVKSMNVTGLSTDVFYKFRVKLMTSPRSSGRTVAVSDEVYKCGVPSAPSNVILSPGCGTGNSASIGVMWTASDSRCTGEVTYKIWYLAQGDENNGQTADNVQSPHILNSLLFNTKYFIRVEARNTAGLNATLDPVQSTTISGVPSLVVNPPTSLYNPASPYPNTTSVQLSWKTPEAGCGSITNYNITYKLQGTSQIVSKDIKYSAKTTTYVITNLLPFNIYEVILEIWNSYGKSTTTSLLAQTTEGRSGPVTHVVTGSTATSIQISWSPPSTPYGVITSYTITSQRTSFLDCDGGTEAQSSKREQSAPKDTSSLQLNDLSPYSYYNITVIPVNGAGDGLPVTLRVSTDSAGPRDVSPKPAVVDQIQTRQCRVTFYQLDCGDRNGPFHSFHYKLVDTSYGTLGSGDTSLSSYQMENLIPYTNYTIQYTWNNANDSSDWSGNVSFTTLQERPQKPSVLVDPGATYIRLNVTPPYPPHAYLTHVVAVCTCQRSCQTTTINQISSINADISASVIITMTENVEPSKNYSCAAYVRSAVGDSEWSDLKAVETKESTSSAPRDFTVVNINTQQVRLQYITPLQHNGVITTYMYECNAIATDNPSLNVGSITSVKAQESNMYKDTEAELTRQFSLNGLSSSTQYSCQIWAVNGAGNGLPANITFWTWAESIQLPDNIKVELDASHSTSSSVSVILPQITLKTVRIRVYRVVVEMSQPELSRRLRSLNTNSLSAYNKLSSHEPYIAAEWNDIRTSFIVGDNQTYNGYYNPQLVTGQNYIIHYGVGSVVDGITDFAFITMEPVTVGSYGDSKQSLVGGVLGSIIVIITIIIALSALYLYRHGQIRFPCVLFARQKRADSVNALVEMGRKKLQDCENANFQNACEAPDVILGVVNTNHIANANQGLIPYPGSEIKHYSLAKFTAVVRSMSEHPQKFSEEFKTLPGCNNFTTDIAMNANNRKKNRYQNMIPYDHSRVILTDSGDGDDVADYINASWVTSHDGKLKYIASQGPLENVSEVDFWRLVWNENVPTIVMLTACYETGKSKSAEYWPKQVGDMDTYGDITVQNLEAEQVVQKVTKRVFELKKCECEGEQTRLVKHYQFVGWPDHGVPLFPSSILQIRELVNKDLSEDSVILVHCSAGVGRTGTYMAIDDALTEYSKTGKISVHACVHRFRHYRATMIQTDRQYVFVYHAVLQHLHNVDRDIPKTHFIKKWTNLKKKRTKAEYQVLDIIRTVDFKAKKSGRSEQNLNKNRSPEIIPDDHDRPMLSTSIEGRTDYINAVFLENLTASPMCIATQRPLPDTIPDLWRLVHDYRIRTIVVLDKESIYDNTREADYWPMSGSVLYAPYEVQATPSTQTRTNAYSTTEVRLSNTMNESIPPIDVKVFQCNDWADDENVPTSTSSLVELYEAVKLWQGNGREAILIQCSDGAMKCGLYGAIYCVLESMINQDTISIYKATRITQSTRPQFISNLVQYEYMYDVIHDLLESRNQKTTPEPHPKPHPEPHADDSECVYENFR